MFKKYAYAWITLGFFTVRKLIDKIDESHLRHHGHASVHAAQSTVEGGE